MKKVNEPQKYDFLDYLRGFAIIGVVLCHIQYLNLQIWEDSILEKIFVVGQMGVPLFFIISAYTLALSSENRIGENNSLKNFYLRRFFRIYPLFFVICILVFSLHFTSINIIGLTNSDFDLSFSNLFLHLSFLFGFFPNYLYSFGMGEWSLFSEVIFYSFFPFLFILIKNKKIIFTLILLILSFLIAYIINIINNFYPFGKFTIYHTPITSIFSFMLGLFLYKIKNLSIKSKYLQLLAYLNIPFYIVITFLFIKFGYQLIFPFFAINIFITVLLFIRGKYKINIKFLQNFFKFTGLISYSLYLINLWFFAAIGKIYSMFIIENFGYNPIIELTILFIAFFMLYIFASLTYNYIELNGINFGRKVIQKIK